MPKKTSATKSTTGTSTNKPLGIYQQYFAITKEYTEKYGRNTILFYQVGVFFEIYGLQMVASDGGTSGGICNSGISNSVTSGSGISGSNSSRTSRIMHSLIEEFTQVSQLNMSIKETDADGNLVLMAGFRDYSLDKYLKIAVNNYYTAVVFTQNTSNPARVTREFSGVYSPGTFISYDTDTSQQISNHIMCIWVTTYKPFKTGAKAPGQQSLSLPQQNLVCGISSAHIFTGETTLFEYDAPFLLSPTTFDELERMVSVISPSEVILISTLSEKQTDLILQYSGIRSATTVHRILLETEINTKKLELIENCQRQLYLAHTLGVFFGKETFQTCSEFQQHIVATQSFCYLLHFLQEHNADLVRKIKLPVFNNMGEHVILANHTLKQLNIIDDQTDDGKKSGRLSSVLSFLNRCCNPMGRRVFQQQMTAPVFDCDWLKGEYDAISNFLLLESAAATSAVTTTAGHMQIVRASLTKVRDLEKIQRQIVMKRIYPNSVYFLYDSLGVIRDLYKYMEGLNCEGNSEILEYLDAAEAANVVASAAAAAVESFDLDRTLQDILSFMDSHLIINKCRGVETVTNFQENIIQPRISPKLDTLQSEYQSNTAILGIVRDKLNNLMKQGKQEDTTEYIKIHETEKSSATLQITKKRAELLRKLLAGLNADAVEFTPNFIIPIKDIRFIKASATNEEIEFPQLTYVFKQTLILRNEIADEVAAAFTGFLGELETRWYDAISRIIQWVIRLDVLQSKAYVAKEYHYCKPVIHEDAEQSFFSVEGLRHVLIEHIQQNELYVANDLTLSAACAADASTATACAAADSSDDAVSITSLSSDSAASDAVDAVVDSMACAAAAAPAEANGILIFGTNAVGKTSFIRAVGIAVIMAQCGMYVPATTFTYKPYTAIFSRIIGNDNLFRGLSTFAVEMSELRVILKMADENSLVLGDELCSGTEMESALSLFSAGLVELHKKRATFLFATHFHEITRYDEIRALSRMKLSHMSVRYDAAAQTLVYDRLLKDGQGTRMYGLEVCKSLYMDAEFLEMAYEFRSKYFTGGGASGSGSAGELGHGRSTYNAKKIRGMCEMCMETMSEEVHHLAPQAAADENGFITTNGGVFHKNHVANLASVCSRCHDKLHAGGSGGMGGKTGGGKPRGGLKRVKTTGGYVFE
jgi:DNA mismatch repair protein MutS